MKNGEIVLSRFEKKIKVTRGKAKHWEHGQRPSADDLEKIGKILGLSARWLLYGEGDPEEKRCTMKGMLTVCEEPEPYFHKKEQPLKVEVDFSLDPELLEEIKRRSKQQFRDIPNQILWELQQIKKGWPSQSVKKEPNCA